MVTGNVSTTTSDGVVENHTFSLRNMQDIIKNDLRSQELAKWCSVYLYKIILQNIRIT